MSAWQRTALDPVVERAAVGVAGADARAAIPLPEGISAGHESFYARVAKPTGDRLAAVCLLVLLAPVIALASLTVLVLCGWSPWYRAKRVGLNGQEFWMLKIRTMRRNADATLRELLESSASLRAEFAARCKITDDPRITGVGRLLRSLSLDELPQLINVMLGHMSLIGPRPVPRNELEEMYGPTARVVCSVRPGVTGLWQVSGRCSTTYSERVAADVSYVGTLGLLPDVKILLATAWAVLTRKGAE